MGHYILTTNEENNEYLETNRAVEITEYSAYASGFHLTEVFNAMALNYGLVPSYNKYLITTTK